MGMSGQRVVGGSDVVVKGAAEAVLAETVNRDYFAAGLCDCVSILAPSGLGQPFGL